MLDIWKPTDDAFVKTICDLHFTASGERLDSSRVEIFRSNECPYLQYELLRFQIKPHVLDRRSGRYTISARSVSYALLSTDSSKTKHQLVPLRQGGEGVYETNRVLGFKATKENVRQFTVLFGHVASRTPFYFFYRLSQVQSLCRDVPAPQVGRIRETVFGIFRTNDDDRLEIEVSEEQHFLVGKYFTLRMPCFYEGHLFVTKLRVAEDGVPHMDTDDRLQVEGVFDEEENYQYFLLDRSPALQSEIEEYARRAGKAHKTAVATLKIDNILQLLILPLFLFHLVVLFDLGITDKEVFSYLDVLKSSTMLSLMSLVLGLLGTALVVFRYTFLEFAIYVRKLVPSAWSQIADETEKISKAASGRLGVPLFVLLNFLEFSLRTLMALTLLLYGVANLPLGLSSLPSINFGESVMTILSNIPLAGGLIDRLVSPNPFSTIHYSKLAGAAISAVVAFLFSTVILGMIGRLLSLAVTKE